MGSSHTSEYLNHTPLPLLRPTPTYQWHRPFYSILCLGSGLTQTRKVRWSSKFKWPMSHLGSGHGLPFSPHKSAWVTVSPTPRLTLNITIPSGRVMAYPTVRVAWSSAYKSHKGSCRLRPTIFLSHLSLGHGLHPPTTLKVGWSSAHFKYPPGYYEP